MAVIPWRNKPRYLGGRQSSDCMVITCQDDGSSGAIVGALEFGHAFI